MLCFDTKGSSEDNVYLLEILDENGNTLVEQNFKNEDLIKNKLYAEFDEIEVDSKKEITARVSVKEKKEGTSCIKIAGNKISKDTKETYYNGHADGYGFSQIYFKAYEDVKGKFYPKSFILGTMVLVFIVGLVPIIYFAKKCKAAKAA